MPHQLDKFLRLSLDLMGIASSDGRFIRLSRSWSRVTGYPVEQLEGRAYIDFLHPEDLAKTSAAAQDLDEGKPVSNFINRFRRSDGEYLHLEWHSAPSEDGQIYFVARDVTHRVRQEILLRRSEAKYRTFFDLCPVGIAITRIRDGAFLECNRALIEPTGYSEEEFKCLTYWELTPEEYAPQENFMLQQVTDTGRYGPYEKEYIRKDGSRYPVLLSGVSMEGTEDGESILFSIVQDITERKEAEKRLKHSQEQFASAFHDSSVGMAIVAVEPLGAWVEVNEALPAIVGYTREELLNSNFQEITHPDDLKSDLHLVRACIDGLRNSYQMEKRYIHKNGEIVWVLLTASIVRDANHKPIHFISQIIDNTQRKTTEIALQKSSMRLSIAAKAARFGIWDLDLERNHLVWDQLMHEIYGTEPLVEGMSVEFWTRRLHPEDADETQKVFKQVVEGKREFATAFRIIRPDGSVRHIKANALTLYNSQGKATNVIGANYDITDQVQAEIAIRENERALQEAVRKAEEANQAKSAFLASMSHEIRTPMNAVIGYTDLLSQQIEDPQLRSYLNAIRNGGKTLLTLINDILDLSKIEAGRIEMLYTPIDPPLILEEISQVFAHRAREKGLELQINIDPAMPRAVLLDDIKLRQILLNLIGNAIKFTLEGSVEVSLYPLQAKPQTDLFSFAVRVRDTGIGIDIEELPHIFDAFQQGKSEVQYRFGGTGLGLAICKRLSEAMNGHIEVESTLGRGSTFTLVFHDIALAPPQGLSDANDPKIPPGLKFQPSRILVVDDQFSNRQLVRNFLEIEGLEILEAVNGHEALEMCHRHAPDLILLDLLMPEMNGFTVIDRLRQNTQTRKTPILILTASIDRDAEFRARSQSIPFLRKPLRQGELVWEIMKLLPHSIEKCPTETASTLTGISKPLPPASLAPFLKQSRTTARKLLDSMVVNDIRAFGNSLDEFGRSEAYPPLCVYAKKIMDALQNFDFSNLRKLLRSFIGEF